MYAVVKAVEARSAKSNGGEVERDIATSDRGRRKERTRSRDATLSWPKSTSASSSSMMRRFMILCRTVIDASRATLRLLVVMSSGARFSSRVSATSSEGRRMLFWRVISMSGSGGGGR